MEYHEGYRICKHCNAKIGIKPIKRKRPLTDSNLNAMMASHLRTMHGPAPQMSTFIRKCVLCNGMELRHGKVNDIHNKLFL